MKIFTQDLEANIQICYALDRGPPNQDANTHHHSDGPWGPRGGPQQGRPASRIPRTSNQLLELSPWSQFFLPMISVTWTDGSVAATQDFR